MYIIQYQNSKKYWSWRLKGNLPKLEPQLIKICELYCASADGMHLFYNKISNIKLKLQKKFKSHAFHTFDPFGPLVWTPGPISKFRKLIEHLRVTFYNKIKTVNPKM